MRYGIWKGVGKTATPTNLFISDYIALTLVIIENCHGACPVFPQVDSDIP